MDSALLRDGSMAVSESWSGDSIGIRCLVHDDVRDSVACVCSLAFVRVLRRHDVVFA